MTRTAKNGRIFKEHGIMNTKVAGFTLIELMIVVAIIGILAAVAVPSYLNYTARSQASEGYYLLEAAKTPVVEYATDTGIWPADDSLGEVVRTLSGKYVASITSTGGGVSSDNTYTLTALFASSDISSRIAGKTVQLQSTDGGKTWVCSGALGTIPVNVRPAACK